MRNCECKIGNAVINDDTDTSGMYDFFWTHALISDQAITAIHKNCNFSIDTGGPACSSALNSIDSAFGNLDIYNIYAPLCTTSGTTSSPKMPSVSITDSEIAKLVSQQFLYTFVSIIFCFSFVLSCFSNQRNFFLTTLHNTCGFF
jgi:Serine carboxypeptidase